MTAPELLTKRIAKIREEMAATAATEAQDAKALARCGELLWQAEQMLKGWEGHSVAQLMTEAYLWDLRSIDARLIQCKIILGDMERRQDRRKIGTPGKRDPRGIAENK